MIDLHDTTYTKARLESELIDNTVANEMLEQYDSLKSEIKEQKDTEYLPDYRKEDLAYNEKLLDACATVLKHYTVPSERPEELQRDHTTESEDMDMKDKDYVIITAILSYRMRYVMHRDDLQKQNPLDPVNTIEWANDIVTDEECVEFSQKHMGEQIIDTVEMNEDDMLVLFDKENDYLSGWTKDKKLKFVRASITSDEVPVDMLPKDIKVHEVTELKWITLAAEQGDADAQFSLGLMYLQGLGVFLDNKTAVKWFTLAAEQGRARAQFYLGEMYHEGQNVPQDHTTAVKWYRLAAEQGNVAAQFNLGWMYHKGLGVAQNHEAARKWYSLAAKQGHADAQFNLGSISRIEE